MANFSDRLKVAMKQRGMNNAQLAREAGLSRGRISQILNENGDPSAASLFPIADALKYEARWLISGKGPKTHEEAAENTVDLTGLPDYAKDAIKTVHRSAGTTPKKAG